MVKKILSKVRVLRGDQVRSQSNRTAALVLWPLWSQLHRSATDRALDKLSRLVRALDL